MDAEDFESGFQDLESGISTLPQGKRGQEEGSGAGKGWCHAKGSLGAYIVSYELFDELHKNIHCSSSSVPISQCYILLQ